MRVLFACSVPLLLFTSCRKEESSQLPEESAIYQDYKVVFDKPEGRTRAFATFRKGGPFGVRLELTGGSSIRFNGQSWTTYAELDNYFYRWSTSSLQSVEFTFTRAGTGTFQNSIALVDTHDVAIASGGSISLANGAQVAWVGRPLEQGERVSAQLKQGSSSSSTVTVQAAGAQSVVFSAQQVSSLAPGMADLVLTRSRTLPLQQADGQAGGRRIVEVEARGQVNMVP